MQHSEIRLNEEDFTAIFISYYKKACSFAVRYVGDLEVARDLTSEVFERLWVKLDNFDNDRSAKAFLFISAKNACLNYLRRGRMIKDHHVKMMYVLVQDEQTPGILSRLMEDELRLEVNDAINSLPRQPRRVLELFREGLSTDEISVIMDLAPQTVRNTKVRGVEFVRERLAKAAC